MTHQIVTKKSPPPSLPPFWKGRG